LWLSTCYPNAFKKAMKKTLYFEIGIFAYVMCMSLTNLGYHMRVNVMASPSSSNSSDEILICIAANEYDVTSDLLNIINRAILPCILIFTCNALSFKKVINMGKRLNHEKKSANFVKSVVIMNFVFVLIYLPWGIVFLIHHITNYSINDPNSLDMSSFVNFYSFQMFYSICDCISYLYFMAAFFLNLTFNALFRREILILLKINPRRISAQNETLNKTFNHSANHIVYELGLARSRA